MNNTTVYAPVPVIAQLDNFANLVKNNAYGTIDARLLFSPGGLLDVNSPKDATLVSEWVYMQGDYANKNEREIAVINHFLGLSLIQPSVPKYLVENNGGIFHLENDVLKIDSSDYDAEEFQGQGMTMEKAIAIAFNFGGEIIEIPERKKEEGDA